MHNIDWSKVKKSPIPKDAPDGVVGWYRGSGIKVVVKPGVMWIEDADGELIIERHGVYDNLTTKDVKDMAKAMINKANEDAAAEAETVPFNGDVLDGIPAGEVHEIAAHVGHGKSYIAKQVADAAEFRQALKDPDTTIDKTPEPNPINVIEDEEHEQVTALRKAVGNNEAVEKFLRSPQGAAAASRFVPSKRNITFALLSGKIGRG